MEINPIDTEEENKEKKPRKYVRKKDSLEEQNLKQKQESESSGSADNIQENPQSGDISAEEKSFEEKESHSTESNESPVEEIKPEEKAITEIKNDTKDEKPISDENEIPVVVNENDSENISSADKETAETEISPAEDKKEPKLISETSVRDVSSDNIEETETTELKQTEEDAAITRESNYQISLIDENLLKVKVTTEKTVSVDCSIKEKSTFSGTTGEKQLNKIIIHPKEDGQKREIEIIVSISGSGPEIIKTEPADIKAVISEPIKAPSLTPNPLVANLIQTFGQKMNDEIVAKTPQEILNERLVAKNPWVVNRTFVRKNLTQGFIGALIIYFIWVLVFYSIASKKTDNGDVVETQRLIVMQDLPENQNIQQHVEDPLKPPEEEKPKTEDDGTQDTKNIVPPLVQKKIKRPPRIIGPELNRTDTTSQTTKIDKELDSLRNANLTKNRGIDTSKFTAFTIPDSLKKEFTQNDVGLIIPAIPKNWKIIDSRMININQTEFEGVLITDTTAKKEGTLNLFIHLDKEGKEFTKEGFKTEFKMDDTTSTAYVKEPLNQAKNIYYRFYIFTKTDKLFVDAQVKEEFFNDYKNYIEALVCSIRIAKTVVNK